MIPSSACPPRHPDQQRPAPNTTATASDSYTTWWDTILERFARRLQGRPAGPHPRALQLTGQRRARLILQLHALDFRLRGAELREIAAALIDADHAALPAIEWKSSATRRKANRLVHDALALMNRGYLKLLRGE